MKKFTDPKIEQMELIAENITTMGVESGESTDEEN